jgi:hypothetical protein
MDVKQGGSMRGSWMTWLAFAVGVTACGGRVSVGDLGTGPPMKSTGTMGGQGIVGDSVYRASGTGPTTTTSGAAGAGGSVPSGAGAGGSAGSPSARPDAGDDGRARVDAEVPFDVGNLGGAACGGIEYPATGFYGDNILVPSYASLRSTQRSADFEIAAKLPPGAALRIEMTWVDGTGGWGDEANGDFLFKITRGPVPLMFTETLEAKESGKLVEHGLQFSGTGRAALEYYECGATTPSGTKMIDWDVP